MVIMGVLLSVIAMIISLGTFYYTFFKKSKPVFSLTSWTAIGKVWDIHENSNGLGFLLDISILNEGAIGIKVRDFIFKIKTNNGEEKIYIPHLLFDFDKYIEKTGEPVDVQEFVKGLVPLPIIVSAKSTYNFKYSILFTPYVIHREVDRLYDGPITIEFYVKYSDKKKYILISKQVFTNEELSRIKKQSYCVVHSTDLTKTRDDAGF